MFQIESVTSARALRSCRVFLSTDPVSNVLPLGDVYDPLIQVSEISRAVQEGKTIGICTVFRAFSLPSLALSTGSTEVKSALIDKAMKRIDDEFITLVPPDDEQLFLEKAHVVQSRKEQQMIAKHPIHVELSGVIASRMTKRDLPSLNKFFAGQHMEAWTPLQLAVGPFYGVKKKGRIISVAGVHLVAPTIAQLGNVVTDPAFRGQGFASLCTSELSKYLAARGRLISLFVRSDNASAIHMYEKLGFHKIRDISFLVMHKNT